MHVETNLRNRNAKSIELCRFGLVENVKCDVPFSEGYGPGNLVTDNFIERSKGFLAERFIKTPVTLVLDFKSDVDVRYLVVNCKVGAQRSTGIEIFSKSSKSENGLYESVASGILPSDKNGFVFHKYNDNMDLKFGDEYHFRTYRPKTSWHLTLVKSLRIKIFKTSGVSVPGLGKFEVWGTVSKSKVSKERQACLEANVGVLLLKEPASLTKEAVELPKGQGGTVNNKLFPQNSFEKKPKSLTDPVPLVNIVNQHIAIPDDFIDPITCEVMIQPVALPCGKIIDNSTLESHNKAEIKWGRGPNDPFTGVQFSSSSKPVAATALKARIDKFLSDNCNKTELLNIPRTLGRNQLGLSHFVNLHDRKSQVSVSKLVSNLSQSSGDFSFSLFKNSSSECKDSLKTNLKRKVDEISSECTKSINGENDCESLSSNFKKPLKGLSGKKEKLNCFQECLEQSLELSLKSTLSKLPKITVDKKVEMEDLGLLANCQVCKCTDTNLFSIRCNHFVCRLCLISSSNNQTKFCLMCKLEYKTSDVKKVHVK